MKNFSINVGNTFFQQLLAKKTNTIRLSNHPSSSSSTSLQRLAITRNLAIPFLDLKTLVPFSLCKQTIILPTGCKSAALRRKKEREERRRRRKRGENVAHHTCAWKPTFRPICADKTERRATQWARRQTGHGYHCRGRVPPRQTGNFHLPQLSFPSLSTSKRSSSSNVARPPPGTILFCFLRDCSPATTVCLAGHSKLRKIFAISAAFQLPFARNAWYFYISHSTICLL